MCHGKCPWAAGLMKSLVMKMSVASL